MLTNQYLTINIIFNASTTNLGLSILVLVSQTEYGTI